MTTDTTASACLNCGTLPAGRYCQACGQRTGIQRFTFRSLLREVPHAIFHVDRGLVATLKAITRHPGGVIRGYLDGQRVRYFNPLTLMVLMAGLSALLFSAYPFDFKVDAPGFTPAVAQKYSDFVRANFKFYSATLIFYLPALACITWISFLGLPATHARNYGEHLIINAYILGYSTGVMVLMFPLFVALNGNPAFLPVWSVVGLGFFIYHGIVLYLVFKRPGSVAVTLLRTFVAILLYFVMLLVATQVAFWLIYMKL